MRCSRPPDIDGVSWAKMDRPSQLRAIWKALNKQKAELHEATPKVPVPEKVDSAMIGAVAQDEDPDVSDEVKKTDWHGEIIRECSTTRPAISIRVG